jgi:hypothetical protein
MVKKVVLLPFLIATFPVISLWASNVDFISPSMVIRSLVLTMALAALLLLLLHLATREWLNAGVITSLILLVVLTYGHFYTILRDIPALNSVIRHRYLLPVIGSLLGFMIILVLKNGKIVPSALMFLTIMGLVLVGLPLTKLFLYQINVNYSKYRAPQARVETSLGTQTNTPDIYYIILDAYGRQDILKELYNFDNSGFIQALETRGFYVADKSNTNYMQTMSSLSSSLNMNYLDDYISRNGGRSSIPFSTELINDNQVRRLLSANGYQTVAFETSFEDLSKADVFLKPPQQKNLLTQAILPTNEFESMLIETTVGKVWLDLFIERNGTANSVLTLPYLQHRVRVIFTLTDLGNVAKMPGRKFVIAHVVSPHPPFIFNRNGGFVSPKDPYALTDGDDYEGGPDAYISGYTEQIQYINKLTLAAVDDILANSSDPPIIIIQGDHGPGAYLKWGSLAGSNVKERMAILNAYYFPDGDYTSLYPSISPVNSFRAVLNKFFGTEMELLPDNHYFSTNFDYSLDGSVTIDFENVNDKVGK